MWLYIGIACGAFVLLWLLLELKRGRPDGKLLKTIHPYRQMLPFVMPGRNESIVFYDDYVKAEPFLAYIRKCREKFHVDITHLLVNAVTHGLRQVPQMNQFVAGQRLYARDHVAITFSMKRKKLDKSAKLAAVKLRIKDEETFEQVCKRINRRIGVERSDAKTYTDKELSIFFKMPRFMVRWALSIVRWADYHNILPGAFIEGDGFFTSTFIANLGSVGMRAAFHHLYEYGTCPLFMMVGRIEDRPTVVDGKVVPQKTLHVRWSYDERIDDGLTSRFGMDACKDALENPEKIFGCIEDFAKDTTASEEAVTDASLIEA